MDKQKPKTVVQKYCVFDPNRFAMFDTLSESPEESIKLATGSESFRRIFNRPEWSGLEKSGHTCQKVTVTIEING